MFSCGHSSASDSTPRTGGETVPDGQRHTEKGRSAWNGETSGKQKEGELGNWKKQWEKRRGRKGRKIIQDRNKEKEIQK
jgi:hypothetical protein